MTEVKLVGGPFDGETIPMEDPRSPLILTGGDVPEGMVARYRPTRTKNVLRFREYDRIVATIPMPGQQ